MLDFVRYGIADEVKSQAGKVGGEGTHTRLFHSFLSEIVLCVGYFCLENPKNQGSFAGLNIEQGPSICYREFQPHPCLLADVLRWGKSPNLLQRLCRIPLDHFDEESIAKDQFSVDVREKSQCRAHPILIPTLIAASYKCETNMSLLSGEGFSPSVFIEYLSWWTRNKEEDQIKVHRKALPSRFPQQLWMSAISFYEESLPDDCT